MKRRAFLAAGGALAVASAGCGGGGKSTTTRTTTGGGERLPGGPDDAGVLAFVLRLEQLQLDLYRRGTTAPFFKDSSEAALIQALAEHERDHVAKLTAELRRLKGRVPRPPALKLPIGDRHGFLAAAYRLENLTASTYLGQIARIRDDDVLATVLSIQTIEGRHAAAVGALLGKTATPDGAFAQGHNMAAIALALDAVAA